MASIPSSPPLISFESAQASPPSPLTQQHQQQQQDGDDGDVVTLRRAIEKLHLVSTALGPEDDNQDDDDEDKAGKKDVDSVDSIAPSEHDDPAAPSGSELQVQQQQQPQQANLDTLEIDRLTQEKHALAKQMKDVSTQFAGQLHALQAQLQQQTAAHDRKEYEWKQQEKQLQKARNDAVDDARRAQAQVQLLEQRMRELEELVPDNNSTSNGVSSPDSQLEQVLTASAESTLHLTQRQYQQQPSGISPRPHAVQRSVVGSATRTGSGSNVTCHPQNPQSDFSSTVRVTRIGRNRSAPSGAASADSRESTQTQASPVAANGNSGSMMMPPPPMNPFQWREDASSYENQGSTTTGYQGYSSPPQQRSSSMLPAAVSVRPRSFYPTQSYNNNYPQHQHQPPVGYPQPSEQFVAPPRVTGFPPPAATVQDQEPTTLISICPIPDEATTPVSTEPQGYGTRLEEKPSSGLLAYCSELLASSLAPSAASASAVAPSAAGANNTNTTSPNAKVAPAWQLFSSSSSSNNNSSSQLGKQTSLDVEQGFSPPRPHQIPLEMQQQQLQLQLHHQQQQSYFNSYNHYNNNSSASALQFLLNYQSSPSLTSPASSSSPPPPQHGRVASVLPTHSFSPF